MVVLASVIKSVFNRSYPQQSTSRYHKLSNAKSFSSKPGTLRTICTPRIRYQTSDATHHASDSAISHEERKQTTYLHLHLRVHIHVPQTSRVAGAILLDNHASATPDYDGCLCMKFVSVNIYTLDDEHQPTYVPVAGKGGWPASAAWRWPKTCSSTGTRVPAWISKIHELFHAQRVRRGVV